MAVHRLCKRQNGIHNSQREPFFHHSGSQRVDLYGRWEDMCNVLAYEKSWGLLDDDGVACDVFKLVAPSTKLYTNCVSGLVLVVRVLQATVFKGLQEASTRRSLVTCSAQACFPVRSMPGEQNQKVARTNGIERMWHSIIIVIKNYLNPTQVFIFEWFSAKRSHCHKSVC